MEEDIQGMSTERIRERLLNLREARKKEYTQPVRKKGRPAELAVDPEIAKELLNQIEEAGGIEAFMKLQAEEEGLDDTDT